MLYVDDGIFGHCKKALIHYQINGLDLMLNLVLSVQVHMNQIGFDKTFYLHTKIAETTTNSYWQNS